MNLAEQNKQPAANESKVNKRQNLEERGFSGIYEKIRNGWQNLFDALNGNKEKVARQMGAEAKKEVVKTGEDVSQAISNNVALAEQLADELSIDIGDLQEKEQLLEVKSQKELDKTEKEIQAAVDEVSGETAEINDSVIIEAAEEKPLTDIATDLKNRLSILASKAKEVGMSEEFLNDVDFASASCEHQIKRLQQLADSPDLPMVELALDNITKFTEELEKAFSDFYAESQTIVEKTPHGKAVGKAQKKARKEQIAKNKENIRKMTPEEIKPRIEIPEDAWSYRQLVDTAKQICADLENILRSKPEYENNIKHRLERARSHKDRLQKLPEKFKTYQLTDQDYYNYQRELYYVQSDLENLLTDINENLAREINVKMPETLPISTTTPSLDIGLADTIELPKLETELEPHDTVIKTPTIARQFNEQIANLEQTASAWDEIFKDVETQKELKKIIDTVNNKETVFDRNTCISLFDRANQQIIKLSDILQEKYGYDVGTEKFKTDKPLKENQQETFQELKRNHALFLWVRDKMKLKLEKIKNQKTTQKSNNKIDNNDPFVELGDESGTDTNIPAESANKEADETDPYYDLGDEAPAEITENKKPTTKKETTDIFGSLNAEAEPEDETKTPTATSREAKPTVAAATVEQNKTPEVLTEAVRKKQIMEMYEKESKSAYTEEDKKLAWLRVFQELERSNNPIDATIVRQTNELRKEWANKETWGELIKDGDYKFKDQRDLQTGQALLSIIKSMDKGNVVPIKQGTAETTSGGNQAEKTAA